MGNADRLPVSLVRNEESSMRAVERGTAPCSQRDLTCLWAAGLRHSRATVDPDRGRF